MNVQANCCPITSTWKGLAVACPFCERMTALTIEIAVTRTAGTVVHAISRPVWPWVGGPSESSPGRARNFQTSKVSTAATTAKTPIAIAVVNQKTKSIRWASLPAATGSQGMSSATAVVIAAATRPRSTS